ncbi:carboxypeptidase Q-like [Diorhabda carinulata]|uniref:carboxypeptidase Q-like n=1 Tax=Diorhabda carinulata TaxID=1163345 RepID=UPI0025A2B897|nr:carboxypeptidase Q-like [Diorhabda carinulata]
MLVMLEKIYFILLLFVIITKCVKTEILDDCNLATDLIKEIQSYRPTVNRIIDSVTKGKHKGKVYNELVDFVDKFGARVSGTKNLEDSIDYLIELMKNNGINNIRGENVTVPHWIRGEEYAQLLEPRRTKIGVLGLGSTVPTPPEGLQAEVLVVRSFEELNQPNVSAAVRGKIVVFNYQFERYGKSVQYRSSGAAEASKHGAVAVLVKSVAPFSMYTLHTGYQRHQTGVKKIPAASITIEDANMFQRYQDRGQKIILKLNINSETLPDAISRNVIAEIRGSQKPNKIVVVSGHSDSWDVGVGAMDDGGGAFISWYSLALLNDLGLKPKRTIRLILWAAEEPGFIGAQAYDKVHKNELSDFTFVMEADEGTFTPLGIEYTAGKKGGCVLKEIVKLLAPINATKVQYSNSVGSDIAMWAQKIPIAGLLNDNRHYFWYHHSAADTIDILDSDTLDKATAVWAVVAYVVADLRDEFPREFEDISKLTSVSLLNKLKDAQQKHN